jgi:transcriptional regulator with XRE-family HTH domain
MERVQYDVRLMAEDMAAKGWLASDVAGRVGVAVSTVTRFLNGEHQSAPMLKRISKVLGRSPRRYIVSRQEVA